MREKEVPLLELCGIVSVQASSHTGVTESHRVQIRHNRRLQRSALLLSRLKNEVPHSPGSHTHIHTTERDFSQAAVTDLVPWAAGTDNGTHEWTEGKLPTQRQGANVVSMSIN